MKSLKRILLITDAFYLISSGLLGPIYALYVEKIGGDLLDASITFSLFMLTAAVVVFLFARWEDKSKHQKKFVVLGYGIGALGTIGYIFVDSPFSLFLIQIILGLSVALKDPAYDALFSVLIYFMIIISFLAFFASMFILKIKEKTLKIKS